MFVGPQRGQGGPTHNNVRSFPSTPGVVEESMGALSMGNTSAEDAAAAKNVNCSFYMRTGTCAYGEKCKYNHPSDTAPPTLNVRGYPTREGTPTCPHYLKKGWCAFSQTCKFNHPINNPMSEEVDAFKQLLDPAALSLVALRPDMSLSSPGDARTQQQQLLKQQLQLRQQQQLLKFNGPSSSSNARMHSNMGSQQPHMMQARDKRLMSQFLSSGSRGLQYQELALSNNGMLPAHKMPPHLPHNNQAMPLFPIDATRVRGSITYARRQLSLDTSGSSLSLDPGPPHPASSGINQHTRQDISRLGSGGSLLLSREHSSTSMASGEGISDPFSRISGNHGNHRINNCINLSGRMPGSGGSPVGGRFQGQVPDFSRTSGGSLDSGSSFASSSLPLSASVNYMNLTNSANMQYLGANLGAVPMFGSHPSAGTASLLSFSAAPSSTNSVYSSLGERCSNTLPGSPYHSHVPNQAMLQASLPQCMWQQQPDQVQGPDAPQMQFLPMPMDNNQSYSGLTMPNNMLHTNHSANAASLAASKAQEIQMLQQQLQIAYPDAFDYSVESIMDSNSMARSMGNEQPLQWYVQQQLQHQQQHVQQQQQQQGQVLPQGQMNAFMHLQQQHRQLPLIFEG